MIGIIDHGRMRATGSVQEVVQHLSAGRRVRVAVVGDQEAAIAVLKPLAAVTDVAIVNGAIEASYEGDDTMAAEILRELTAGGIKVSGFTQVDGGLEEAFMRATSEEVG
jgi:ABC-type multidrug transport system ATPase subunit